MFSIMFYLINLKKFFILARSPVIGHINASLEGLTTIRANKAQTVLSSEFDNYQDLYNSVTYMSFSISRAFGFYLEIICTCYIAMITFTLVYFQTGKRIKILLS